MNSKRLLQILLGIAIAITGIHLLLQYLNLEVFYQQNGLVYELSNRYDLDDEASVSTWFSQAVFILISMGAILSAHMQKVKSARNIWLLIGVIGLLLSIDEVAALHEFVLQSVHVLFYQAAPPTLFKNAWWLVVPIVLIVSAWLLAKMWRLLPRRTIIFILFGTGIFISGAVFTDLLISTIPRETFFNQGILVAIEESLEMLGSVIVFYAIAEYIEAHHRTPLVSALKQLKSQHR